MRRAERRRPLPAAGKDRHAKFQSLESTGIARIEIYKFDLPLRGDFSISGSGAGFANNVLVSIRTNDGLIGWGEASPVSRVTGETQKTCIAAARKLRSALHGRDSHDINRCVRALDRTLPGNTTIKSAFDIALHDLAAQRVGLPLWITLGHRRTPPVLHTDATLFIRPLDQIAARTRVLLAEGFRILKIKLGDSSRDDIARVCVVREIAGPRVELRADANECWSPAYAQRILPALNELGVIFCEQPLGASARSTQATLARSSPVPLLADESLFTPRDAQRIIREKSFHGFNIKLSKSGGLFHAREIARLAALAKLPCMIGCMNESRLGLSASAHLAAATPAIRHYDLDSFLMQSADFIEGGVTISRGRIVLPSGPGLGARPTAAWLKKNRPVT